MAAALAIGGGCRPSGQGATAREATPPAAVVQWRRDSADYSAALAKYVRDSRVLDSMARAVDTRALEQLYRRALTADRPELVIQQVSCEHFRLIRRHGLVPAQMAITRVEDRAWSDPAAVARMEARMPRSGFLSSDRCAELEGKPLPDTVNGVPIRTDLRRPVPPRRPWQLWFR